MKGFLDRVEELALLDRLWSGRRAELLVLYGRRRVGKTELLVRFGESRRTIFLEATDVRLQDQLRDFGAAYADGLGLGAVTPEVRDWDHLLELVGAAAERERTLVVFDEFQHLARQQQGLGSLISRWWRTTGSRLNLVLVLSGSDVAFFADEVLGANAALHGRRTADYRLQPFSARDAALFFPAWDPEDRVRAFSVWGGMPYYLAMIDDTGTLAENILTSILAPGAPLQNEADYLIRMESRLRDTALYGSVLRALSAGRTSVAHIAGHLGGADTGNVSRQLERLQDVGLVREVRPLLVARRTDVRYQISDPFLRFWYRFVATAGARLNTHAGAQRYLDHVVMPALDEFTSQPTFEEICQADLAARLGAATVGRWWGPITEHNRDTGRPRTVNREADAVALDDKGNLIGLATCKWTHTPVDISELNKLRRIAAHLAPGRAVPLTIYTRTGVDDRIAAEVADSRNAIHVVRPGRGWVM